MAYRLHEKLTRSLLREMASGIYRDGQRFLSLRSIGRTWGVSEPTVCSSLKQLVAWGLLSSEARRGYFLCRSFREKAQLLLRRNRKPALKPLPTLQQKVRLLRHVRGGTIAVLLETDAVTTHRVWGEIPEKISPSVRRCAVAFEKKCRRDGFDLRWFLYDGGEEATAWVRQRLEEGEYQGAAAFCRSSHKAVKPLLEPLMQRHLPVVIMYDHCQGLPVNSVNLNDVGAGFDAIRQLYKAGHRRIAVLAQRPLEKVHQERVRGALLAQAEGGCPGLKLDLLRFNPGKPLPAEIVAVFQEPHEAPSAIFSCSSRLIIKLAPVIEERPGRRPEAIVCSSKSWIKGVSFLTGRMDLNVAPKVGRIAAKCLSDIQNGEALERVALVDIAYVRYFA